MVEKLRQANEELNTRAHELADTMTRELRTSADKDRLLAAVVEQSSDAIITRDLDNNITSWNQAAEKMFGYQDHEIIGASIDRILKLPAGPEGMISVSDLSHAEHLHDVLGKKRDGGYINLALSNAPLFDSKNNSAGTISIIRDVTD